MSNRPPPAQSANGRWWPVVGSEAVRGHLKVPSKHLRANPVALHPSSGSHHPPSHPKFPVKYSEAMQVWLDHEDPRGLHGLNVVEECLMMAKGNAP
eukprot:SAG11_NODE_1323_length_5200_cov_7.642423_3_plen_96_part_00